MVRNWLTIGWRFILIACSVVLCNPLHAESSLNAGRLIANAIQENGIQDAYWQYYSDCDQWGVVFTEAPVVGIVAGPCSLNHPIKEIAPANISAIFECVRANFDYCRTWSIAQFQNQTNDIAPGKVCAIIDVIQSHFDCYRVWSTAQIQKCQPLLAKSMRLLRQMEFHSVENKPTKSASHPGSGTVFRQVSARIYKKTAQPSQLKTSIADKLEWLGRNCLEISDSLR